MRDAHCGLAALSSGKQLPVSPALDHTCVPTLPSWFYYRRFFQKRKSLCCLAMTRAYIETHFADTQAHACAVEQRMDGSACTKEALLADNAYDQKTCETWRYPCILIDQTYHVELPE